MTTFSSRRDTNPKILFIPELCIRIANWRHCLYLIPWDYLWTNKAPLLLDTMGLSLNKQSTASTWYHGVISEQTKHRFYLIPWGSLWANKTRFYLIPWGYLWTNKTPLLLDTMGLSLNKQNAASTWYHGDVAE
jgi:hypothetical protein